ncbi:hypothetical protein LNO89_02070 [Klebsiella pneumoniae subsp. pneumoniae]|nr:hypothetical protein [Klebsiella pneumoniae subsp. pneumoniae]
MTLANQKTIATNGDGYAVLPFATAYHRNDALSIAIRCRRMWIWPTAP